MNRLSITVFVMFTVFSNNALGISMGKFFDSIKKNLNINIKRGPSPSEKFVLETVDKIEKRLGFDFEDSFFSLKDIDDLIDSRFNPFENKAIRDTYDNEDTETFKKVLFEYIRDNHLDSPVVLRWWDLSPDLRNTVFVHLDKDHLSSPWKPTLLLKWWDEAVSRGMEDRLKLFIEQGFREMGYQPKIQLSDPAQNGYIRDPFIRTVLRATQESSEFADHVQRILEP